jgi:hypothetical protein
MGLKSYLWRRSVLSDLRKVQQLQPVTQSGIAKQVVGFINSANAAGAMNLPMFFTAAQQQRHDAITTGPRTHHDPVWAAAALKEAWCAAKLGKQNKSLPAVTADAVVQEIEKFVFDPRHQSA